LCFLKKEEEREGEREEEEGREEATSLPLKIDLILVIYKILKKTLVF
jgi:hypothetical protein